MVFFNLGLAGKKGEEPPSIPKHIVIIPDGNRRWARARKVPQLEGHRQGIDLLRKVMEWARRRGVKTITFWGLSLENLNRGQGEIGSLLGLFEHKFEELKNHSALHEEKVRVRFFGRLDKLTPKLRDKIKEVEEETKGYTNYNVNILLSYGGRQELVDACNKAIADVKAGRISAVNEKKLGEYMYLSGQDDPDLIIRTSGEKRLSGILPWESGYSELYFCDKLWPDFSEGDFDAALKEFSSRKRRFGK